MIAWSVISLLGLITVVNGQANCPAAQAPFMPNGVPVACSPANPTVACGPSPAVFCQTVTTNAAQFQSLCCLNIPASCPNNQVPALLPPTSTAIPCVLNQVNTNCPLGSTCTSVPSNPVGVQTICCTNQVVVTTTTVPVVTTTIAGGINPGPGGTLSVARCVNTAERPYFEPGTTYYRNCALRACPTTHRCEYDSVNRVNACCGPPATTSATDCPVGNVLMYPQTGSPVTCTIGSSQCPTSNRYCQYSASFGYNVCCSTTTGTVSSTECPANGIYMYPASASYPASPLVCPTAGSTTECPASNRYCLYSSTYRYNICCSTNTGTIGATDCSSTDVFLSGGAVVTCSSLGVGQCPSTYAYCTYSASRRQNVCCRQNVGK